MLTATVIMCVRQLGHEHLVVDLALAGHIGAQTLLADWLGQDDETTAAVRAHIAEQDAGLTLAGSAEEQGLAIVRAMLQETWRPVMKALTEVERAVLEDLGG